MTVTDEPGYYEDGKFGIRIENVLLIEKKTTEFLGYGEFLGFEHITVVPISTKLVNVELLTGEELKWLNEYNRMCYEKVSPLLEVGSIGHRWLEKESLPLAG
jgi:Xaa-Pro aminopeptidase